MTHLRSALGILAVLTAGCAGKEPGSAASQAPGDSMPGMVMLTLTSAQVQHAGVRWGPVTERAGATGATVPGQVVPDEDRTARLGAPARGRIVAVAVRPGDRVAAGQPLVTLLSPEGGTAQADLAKARAELAARHAEATFARIAAERAERLFALKVLARQEVERATADRELAAAALAQAEAELQRAEVTAEQLGASNTRNGEIALRAPQAGIVLTRTAVPGAVVEAGTLLVVVTDPTRLWLTVDAPESFVGSFRLGDRLRFTVSAFPSDTFTARIDAIAPGLDPDTRTLAVRAGIQHRGGKLRPEMLATVAVVKDPTVRVLAVPDEAIQEIGGKMLVFMATPDGKGGVVVMSRDVELGARSGGWSTILHGLSAGETIITRGAIAVKAEHRKGTMPKMEM
jgi:cobalt-zinc-cadmium efflux system membrane fusion protein